MLDDGREFRKSEINSYRLLHGGTFALGIFFGCMFCLLFYLLLQMSHAWLTRTEFIEVVPSVSALMVASVSLLISFSALIEQKRMRQAGTDPVLVAHVGQREDEPMVMTLNISNVGAGAALNVFANVIPPETSKLPNFITNIFEAEVLKGAKPIRVILQGASISFDMGVGHELLGDNLLEKFEVRLKYQDIDGAAYESVHLVDASELIDRPANSPASTKVWREIEKLRKSMEKIK